MDGLKPVEPGEAPRQAAWHTDRGHSALALALTNTVLADAGCSPDQTAMAWTLRNGNLYLDGSYEAGVERLTRPSCCLSG